MALFNDLILCYPLDSNANDLQGGYNGTPTDISYVGGVVGDAAYFNGTSSKIALGRIPAIEGLTSFSIAFWLNIDAYGSGNKQIFYMTDGGAGYFEIRFNSTYSQFVTYLYSSSGNASYKVINISSFPEDTWVHVIATFSPIARIYVNSIGGADGVLIGSPAMLQGASCTASLGSNTNSSEFLTGAIDQFCFWDRVLTSDERTALYNSGAGVAWPMGGIVTGPFTTTDKILGNGYSNPLPVGNFTTTDSITATLSEKTIEKYLVYPDMYTMACYRGYPPTEVWSVTTAGRDVVCFDDSGNIYILTSSNIAKYNSAGTLQWSYTGATTPSGIAVNADGSYLYYSSSAIAGRVRKIATSDRSEVTTDNWPLDSTDITATCTSCKVGRDGFLYVIEDDKNVHKIDPADGSIEWSYSIPQGANGNEINDYDINSAGAVVIGSIEVGNTGEPLRKITSAGALAWAVYPYTRQMPVQSVAIDESGNVYFQMYDQGTGQYNSAGSSIVWDFLEGDADGNYGRIRGLSGDESILYMSEQDPSASAGGLFAYGSADGALIFRHTDIVGANCDGEVIATESAWGIHPEVALSNGTMTNDSGYEITGSAYVPIGEDYTINFVPDAGYVVGDVEIDGVSVGAVGSYEFTNVTGQHTISATYALGYSVGVFETLDSMTGAGAYQVPAGVFTTDDVLSASALNQVVSGNLTTVDQLSGDFFAGNCDELVLLYKFVLTGANDSLADVEIPISSFQMRQYNTNLSYLSVVIPNLDSATDISDRANGTLELYLCYADTALTELLRIRLIEVSFDSVYQSEGPVNQSITLSGNETTAMKNARLANIKSVTLTNAWVNYSQTTDGKIRLRLSKPHRSLIAGDTAISEAGTFVVDMVTWTESAEYRTIEISEAA